MKIYFNKFTQETAYWVSTDENSLYKISNILQEKFGSVKIEKLNDEIIFFSFQTHEDHDYFLLWSSSGIDI